MKRGRSAWSERYSLAAPGGEALGRGMRFEAVIRRRELEGAAAGERSLAGEERLGGTKYLSEYLRVRTNMMPRVWHLVSISAMR